MKSDKLLCVGCKTFVTPLGKCDCDESCIVNTNDENEMGYYAQEVLHFIKYLMRLNVPGNRDEERSESLFIGAQNIYNTHYTRNGIKFCLKDGFEPCPDRMEIENEANNSDAPHNEILVKNAYTSNGSSFTSSTSSPATLHVRLIQDWNNDAYLGAKVEIIGEQLKWKSIVQGIESSTLLLECHFYDWIWYRLLCVHCARRVKSSGECGCYETAIISKREEDIMQFYRDQLVEVIKCLVKQKIPSPSDFHEDWPYYIKCATGSIRELKLYENGVSVFVIGWFRSFSWALRRNWTRLDMVEPLRGEEVQENSIISCGSGSNIDSKPYTLHVRLRSHLGSDHASQIEILGSFLNWQTLLEDLQSKSANIEWHFYAFDCDEDNDSECDSYDEEDEEEEYVQDEEFIRFLNQTAQDSSDGGSTPAALSAVQNLATEIVDNGDVECCICLDPMSRGDLQKKMPCGHGYHNSCIDQWLSVGNFCPICKQKLPTEDLPL